MPRDPKREREIKQNDFMREIENSLYDATHDSDDYQLVFAEIARIILGVFTRTIEIPGDDATEYQKEAKRLYREKVFAPIAKFIENGDQVEQNFLLFRVIEFCLQGMKSRVYMDNLSKNLGLSKISA